MAQHASYIRYLTVISKIYVHAIFNYCIRCDITSGRASPRFNLSSASRVCIRVLNLSHIVPKNRRATDGDRPSAGTILETKTRANSVAIHLINSFTGKWSFYHTHENTVSKMVQESRYSRSCKDRKCMLWENTNGVAGAEWEEPLIAKLTGPPWGPSGADRTQMGPMVVTWTLLSGTISGFTWAQGKAHGVKRTICSLYKFNLG